MTTSPNLPARRRGGRGLYKKSAGALQPSEAKRNLLPEYLEKAEVDALIACAPNPQARLVILTQWRAGLRISEALALTAADFRMGGEHPTLVVYRGKGGRSRTVPVHAELRAAINSALAFGSITNGPIIPVTRQSAWRWVKQGVQRAVELGQLAPGRKVGTHTLRHSFARHALSSGVPINIVSRWLGHASIQTTLIYLQVLPDPMGDIDRMA